MSTTHLEALFTTKNDLPEKVREDAVVLLNQVLADITDLYLQTKQAHWNVRGPYFFTLHKLFDELAEGVEEYIDTTAERVTALGGVARGTARQVAAASRLVEFPTGEQGEPLSYVQALSERFSRCAEGVRKGIDAAAELGDADTADLFTGLSRELDKGLWFLEAHLR